MPTILPQPTTPQPLPSGPAVPVATVSNVPPALAQLPVGTQLRAEIIQMFTRGVIEAQTEFGLVQLRTNFAWPEGAKVELQVLRTNPQLQLAIRQPDTAAQGTVHRNLPSAASHAATLRAHSVPATTVPSASAALPALAVGAVIRATIAAPIAGMPSQGPAPPASNAPIGQPAAETTPNAPSSPHRTSANRAGPFDVRIIGLAPAGQSLPNAPVSRSNAQTGVVTAFTTGGRPIVETPLGMMTLEAVPADAAIGSRIQFTPVPAASPRAQAIPLSNFPASFVEARAWPALEEAVAHLAQKPVEGVPVQLPLPQANRQLGANIMLILAALRGADIRTWLGNAATLLESERPDLAARANEEFAQLARVFNEASSNDWRTAVVPFYNGAHLEPVQMHLRGGKSERDNGKQDEGSRFIIDIQLSRLGRIQLDGFVKKQGSDKKMFDLIVRTDDPLPQQMRRDIHQIFSAFGEAAGIPGALTFQARGRFVDVALPRLAPAAQNGLFV